MPHTQILKPSTGQIFTPATANPTPNLTRTMSALPGMRRDTPHPAIGTMAQLSPASSGRSVGDMKIHPDTTAKEQDANDSTTATSPLSAQREHNGPDAEADGRKVIASPGSSPLMLSCKSSDFTWEEHAQALLGSKSTVIKGVLLFCLVMFVIFFACTTISFVGGPIGMQLVGGCSVALGYAAAFHVVFDPDVHYARLRPGTVTHFAWFTVIALIAGLSLAIYDIDYDPADEETFQPVVVAYQIVCVCRPDRERGLFLVGGAPRSGGWARQGVGRHQACV